MGGDALIISDLGLLDTVATRMPGARIHVSSVATCRNPRAARLCRELGASRLILPRDVTLAEACEIAHHMTSEHLRLMQRCGFLDSTKDGQRRYYRVIEPQLANIIQCVEQRFGV